MYSATALSWYIGGLASLFKDVDFYCSVGDSGFSYS